MMLVRWWGEEWNSTGYGPICVCRAKIEGHGWDGDLANVHGDEPGQWPAELAEACLAALELGLRALHGGKS